MAASLLLGWASGLSPRARRILAAVGVLLGAMGGVALLFPGVVLGREHFWGDFATWYYPSHAYAVERARQGAWPLWNPYSDCGMPFAGEADHGTFYPPSWLLHALAGARAPLFRGLELFVLLHMVLAILTLYAFLRRVGCGRLAALAGGFAYGLGGEFVARSGQVSLVCAQAWLPLALGGAFTALRRDAAWGWGVVVSASAVGLIGLSGSPATLVVTIMGLIVLVPVAALLNGPGTPWRRSARGLLVLSAVLLIGVLLAGTQLVPMKEFVELSERSAYSYDEVTQYSATPASLIMLVVPRFFGWLTFDRPSYWGPNNFTELSAYVGLLPLALALLALRLRPRAETLPWLVLAVVALFVALGQNGGLHWLVYRYVPFIGAMRAPGRYLLLWDFGVAVLSALGLDAALRRKDEPAGATWNLWRASLTGALLAFAVFAALLAAAMEFWTLESWPQALVAAGLWKASLAGLGAVLGLALLGRLRHPYGGTLVVLLVVNDLTMQGRGIGIVPDSPETRGLLQPSTGYGHLLAADRSLFRVKDRYIGPADLMLDHLQSEFGPGRHLLDYTEYVASINSQESPLFDLLNIKYLADVRNSAVVSERPNLVAQQYLGLKDEESSLLDMAPARDIDGLDVVTMTHVIDPVAPGFVVGQLELLGASGETRVLPLRIGMEVADVALGERVTAAQVISPAHFVDVTDIGTLARRHYLATFRFPALRVAGVRVRNAGRSAELSVKGLYLHASVPGASAWRSIWNAPYSPGRVLQVFENTDVMPRALLVPRARSARSRQEALALVTAAGFDPRHEIVLEGALAGGATGMAAAPADPGTVRVERFEPESIALAADVPAEGSWLLLSEVYYPGWTASVDGRPSPIVRANGLFRALWLGAGRHAVVFRYEPRSFALGVRCSVLGLVGLGALAALTARKRASRVASRARSAC